MQAFHNDPAIKAKYVARVRRHIEADELVRGGTGEDGRGCAVWCTLGTYDHKAYETQLGVPQWLAFLEDAFFENMSVEKSKTWPLEFLEAMTPGVDIDKIKGPFLVFILENALKTFDHEKSPAVKTAMDDLIALWRRDDVDSPEWEDARIAARVVWAEASPKAQAASEAAWAATRGAVTWAMRAAIAGEMMRTSRPAAFDRFADELLRLVRATAVGEVSR